MFVIPPDAIIWALRLYNVTTNIIEFLYSQTERLCLTLQEAFSKKSFVLFADIPFMYNNMHYTTTSPLSAKPLWMYDPIQMKFTEYSTGTNETKKIYSIPVLSMELVENDSSIHDMTTFIEKLCIESTEGKQVFPSVAHIMRAWMFGTGVVLDPSRSFKVRMINLSADTVEFPVDSMNCIVAEERHESTDIAKTD